MDLKILDGRGSFYQWDLNRKLLVEDDRVEQLHFSTADETALVCPVYKEEGKRVADVPNILLQTGGDLWVFAVAKERTLYARKFLINPKEKPEDYIYTETEAWTVQKAVEQALAEARESGAFDGPPGPKGDPGVVKFVVVNKLPETDTENAIYLVPVSDGTGDNLFNEYIYVDAKWEQIGSAAVQVDLTGYVKKTNIATPGGEAGLLKLASLTYGLEVLSSNQCLRVQRPTDSQIADRKNYSWLAATLGVFDKTLKASLTTNTEELTDEEKAAACGWLGTGVVTANEDGTLSVKLADGNAYKIAATKEA